MKIIFLVLLSVHILFGDTLKVYFYASEKDINNFRSLKVSFDNYLSERGEYEFQPFNNKETFETYLRDENVIVILSSWHYQKIAKKYKLVAELVAQRKNSITDTKILVGKKNITHTGLVTSAYDKEYTKELLNILTNKQYKNLPVLLVPKEIDALMSVGFGMSEFALVSKDTLLLLQKINPFLADNLRIYEESKPKYRMLLAHNNIDEKYQKLIKIFKDMGHNESGKNILNMIGIDRLIVLRASNLKNLGGAK